MPSLKQSALDKLIGSLKGAGDVVGQGVNAVKNSPQIRLGTEPVGAAVGGLGGLLGGLTGAIGNPIANTIQGKPTFQNWGKDVADTAKSTAGFGYNVGKEGAFGAMLGGAGKIANAAVALPSVTEGIDQINKGDYAAGGAKLGLGAVGMYGAAKQPNWTPGGIFDPQLKALGSKIMGSGGGMGGTMKDVSGVLTNGGKGGDVSGMPGQKTTVTVSSPFGDKNVEFDTPEQAQGFVDAMNGKSPGAGFGARISDGTPLVGDTGMTQKQINPKVFSKRAELLSAQQQETNAVLNGEKIRPGSVNVRTFSKEAAAEQLMRDYDSLWKNLGIRSGSHLEANPDLMSANAKGVQNLASYRMLQNADPATIRDIQLILEDQNYHSLNDLIDPELTGTLLAPPGTQAMKMQQYLKDLDAQQGAPNESAFTPMAGPSSAPGKHVVVFPSGFGKFKLGEYATAEEAQAAADAMQASKPGAYVQSPPSGKIVNGANKGIPADQFDPMALNGMNDELRKIDPSWVAPSEQQGPQPGPWTEAYARPMEPADQGVWTGLGFGDQRQAARSAGNLGATSQPKLTSGQQSAATKFLKQISSLSKLGAAADITKKK